MSSFVLKIIACISMFIDHFNYVWFDYTTYLNCIGRFAFPIFAFQLTESYIHTHNLQKYFIKLFIFAIISQLPFMLFYSIFSNDFTLNIMFTLILGLLFITFYDKVNKLLGFILGIFFAFLANKLHFDYGWYGISIIMIFYILKNHKVLMTCSFIFVTLLKYILPLISLDIVSILNILSSLNLYTMLCLFTSLSIIFILFYNNKKGQDFKYFLYIFYPVHLILIYLLNLVI